MFSVLLYHGPPVFVNLLRRPSSSEIGSYQSPRNPGTLIKAFGAERNHSSEYRHRWSEVTQENPEIRFTFGVAMSSLSRKGHVCESRGR